jgi:hypothetical protein
MPVARARAPLEVARPGATCRAFVADLRAVARWLEDRAA